jgi:zinc/manganese transport system ATP-binding protein
VGQPARRAGPPVVSLRDVSITLGARLIQGGMTLEVEEGELVAVLGPNGAGKSTLLKLLLGLIRSETGSVEVLGGRAKRGNWEIGYVPQFRAVEADGYLRVRDVVRFGLDGNRWGPGLPSRKRNGRVDEALAEVGASGLAESPVGHLSGGERQRILIAQALLSDPRLLLLDEPLAGLDIARSREIVALVGKICRARGVAVLFVTHDINPLLSDVDRVLYLANGRSAVGDPGEVITGEVLSRLYGTDVEVVRTRDRVFVLGAPT